MIAAIFNNNPGGRPVESTWNPSPRVSFPGVDRKQQAEPQPRNLQDDRTQLQEETTTLTQPIRDQLLLRQEKQLPEGPDT